MKKGVAGCVAERETDRTMPTAEELRAMNGAELEALCGRIRQLLIETVSKTGGHLSSNLGIVELTVALHRSFSLPHDRIVWDVGHQCYVHKLLTGRADRFDTLRQEGGVAGFPRPCESETDCFIVGHSSTSVSAANGMAKAKALLGDDGYVVAVIGDGAMTGGLAYEGLSNAGRSRDRLIVVLNDNRMSISHNVGFVARHLAKLRLKSRYVRFKKRVETVVNHLPLIGAPLYRFLAMIKVRLKKTIYSRSTMFEEMGFYYLGPIDGHNLRELSEAMITARNLGRPVLMHVETVKGKGYPFAAASPDTYHGVSGFNIETGQTPASGPSFSSVFGESLCALAEQDERICAMTAAMKTGTCLTGFAERFPTRFFDVGIAEEHAVTFSSGLAQGGMLPVFAVYSTFLQRSYDQILNDAALNDSHIVLAVDRAGVVPDDGETHQGIFDPAFLGTIPRVTVYAPATFEELRIHLKQALYDVTGVAVVRYPKGDELPMPDAYRPDYKPFSYFQAAGAKTLLVTYGRVFSHVLTAAEQLAKEGVLVSVLKLNRIRPVEEECVSIALGYRRVLFFEEAIRTGGVGEWFGNELVRRDYARSYEIYAADGFLDTCTTASGLHRLGLDVEGVLRAVRGDGAQSETVEEKADGE